MNNEILLEALENIDNEYVLNFTTAQLNDIKLNILKELELSPTQIISWMEKLKDYYYVDDINHLIIGRFIRWVPLQNIDDKYTLKMGGFLSETKIMDQGISFVCKGFMGNHFQFKMDNSIIFQKMTEQEKILLSASDYLSK